MSPSVINYRMVLVLASHSGITYSVVISSGFTGGLVLMTVVI